MKTSDLIYFNFGGGHRSSTLALEKVIRDKNKFFASTSFQSGEGETRSWRRRALQPADRSSFQ
jgi:hypothetical protein